MTKSITWLEFLAIENRIRAVLMTCKDLVPESKLTFYSLSDNTLAKYWVKTDPEGFLDDNLFVNIDILFSSKICMKDKFHGLYVELEILSNGQITCTAYLEIPENRRTTFSAKLLSETKEVRITILLEEHRELFRTVILVFRILREIVYESSPRYLSDLDNAKIVAIKKYIIGIDDEN